MYISLGLEVPFRGRKEVHALKYSDLEKAELAPGVPYVILKRSKMKQYQGGLDQNGDPPCDLNIFENSLYPNLSFPKWFGIYSEMRQELQKSSKKVVPANLFLAATSGKQKGSSVLDQLQLQDTMEQLFGAEAPVGISAGSTEQRPKRPRANTDENIVAPADDTAAPLQESAELGVANSTRPKLKEARSMLKTKYLKRFNATPLGEGSLGAIVPVACVIARSRYLTTSHGLRRSYIHAMRKAGVDTASIMKRTGHRTVAALLKYMIEEDLDDDYDVALSRQKALSGVQLDRTTAEKQVALVTTVGQASDLLNIFRQACGQPAIQLPTASTARQDRLLAPAADAIAATSAAPDIQSAPHNGAAAQCPAQATLGCADADVQLLYEVQDDELHDEPALQDKPQRQHQLPVSALAVQQHHQPGLQDPRSSWPNQPLAAQSHNYSQPQQWPAAQQGTSTIARVQYSSGHLNSGLPTVHGSFTSHMVAAPVQNSSGFGYCQPQHAMNQQQLVQHGPAPVQNSSSFGYSQPQHAMNHQQLVQHGPVLGLQPVQSFGGGSLQHLGGLLSNLGGFITSAVTGAMPPPWATYTPQLQQPQVPHLHSTQQQQQVSWPGVNARGDRLNDSGALFHMSSNLSEELQPQQQYSHSLGAASMCGGNGSAGPQQQQQSWHAVASSAPAGSSNHIVGTMHSSKYPWQQQQQPPTAWSGQGNGHFTLGSQHEAHPAGSGGRYLGPTSGSGRGRSA